VKWQSLLITVIFIAAILAAGCTEEENPHPQLPAPDSVRPGQVFMLIGNVTGNGIPGGSIDNLTFTVGLIPGENPVNMENISLVYADAVRTETLLPVEGFRGDPPPGSAPRPCCPSKVSVVILHLVTGGFWKFVT